MLEIQVSVYMWKEGREGQREGDNPWVYLLQIHISIFMLVQNIEAALLGRRLQLGESTLYPWARGSCHHGWGALGILVPARKKPDSTGLKDPNTMKGLCEGHPAGPSHPTAGNPGTQASSGPGMG